MGESQEYVIDIERVLRNRIFGGAWIALRGRKIFFPKSEHMARETPTCWPETG